MTDRDEGSKPDQKTETKSVTPMKSPTFPSQHRGDFSQYSPFTTRSRKITSPGAGFPMSPAFDSFSTSSDLSDSVTPNPSPQVGRRRLVSTGEERFPFTSGSGQPPLFSPMSRSSSTLSLCSNVSSAATPIDKLTRHLSERLVGYLFSGWYTERRFIDAIDRYRDVILVDNVEAVVIKQAKFAVRKSAKIFEENSFIGCSIENDECKLFVNFVGGGLEVTYPFGHYWFKFNAVTYIPNVGINFEIGIVRQYVSSDSVSCWRCKAREKQEDTEAPAKMDSIGDVLLDMKTRVASLTSAVVLEVWHPAQAWSFIRPQLSLANLVNLGKLLLVLLLAGLTGLVAGVKQLSQFALRALHELANLVERSTPLALGALNMVGKVFGGAYLLIAMIWRDSVQKPKVRTVTPPSAKPGLGMVESRSGGGASAGVMPLELTHRRPGDHSGPRGMTSDYRGAMDSVYSQSRNW